MKAPDDKNTEPANYNNELAKERTYAAYENTFLAWVRTSLALMGFGVGIFEFAGKTGGNTIFNSSRMIGLLLIILATISIFLALLDTKKNNAQLADPNFRYGRKTTLAIQTGYVLLIICVLALIRAGYQMITLGI